MAHTFVQTEVAMFEVYMQEQSIDPGLRNRLMVCAMAAMAMTTGGIALTWTMNQLSISQVSAPKVVQQVMLSLSAEPPPPPAPPARPKAAAASDDSTSTSTSHATAKQEDAEAEVPDEDAVPSVDGKARAPVGGGGVPGVGGVPGGPGGGGGCIGPLCSDVPVIGTPTGIPRPTPETVIQEPLSHVKARSLFTPDPDVSALAKTATALMSRRSGKVSVAFCVAPSGKVESAKVTKRFGQDAAVDNLCRKAVMKWRFKPAKIAGKARKTCSEVTFDLRFDP